MRRSSCLSLLALSTLMLSACSTITYDDGGNNSGRSVSSSFWSQDYSSRMPATIASSEKTVVVDPRVHAWGAYENGTLVKAGQATAGSSWCPDIGKPCRTKAGQFRINSLGSAECKSHKFPVGKGGAPMPYCMYFNGGQALHGVHDGEVVDGNISHGCVRMHVQDAEWIRKDFAKVGTKVVVEPYED